MIILALDPSLKAIGWALLDSGADKILASGEVCKHATQDIDVRLYRACIWLRHQLHTFTVFGELYAPNIVAIEMPIHVHNAKTYCEQCQLVGALRLEISYSGMSTITVYPSERRKVMGMDFKRKSAKEVKQMIMDEVNKRYGLEIESDHESDAVAIALAAKEKLNES